MSLIGKLAVSIIGEDTLTDTFKQIEKNAKTWQKNINKIGNNLTRTGQLLTTSLTLPIIGVGGAMLKSGMDAVESEALFTVSMGRMGEAARKWSTDLRDQLGLNSYETRKYVGTFNVMLESMGLSEEAAYGMSTSLVELAHDMTAFYNLDGEEAFEKIRSGIVGQIRPLRDLGVNIDDATIKTYAYQNGIATAGEEMTQAQKVMARFGAIMEQTTAAQGALARELDNPASRFRVLKQQISEAATEMGMAFMPVVEEFLESIKPLVAKITELAQKFTELDDQQKKNVLVWLAIAAAAGPVLIIAGQLVKTIGLLVSVVKNAAIVIMTIVGVAGKIVFAFKAMAAGAATFSEAMVFAAPQIAIVVAAAAALAIGLTYLTKKKKDDTKATKDLTAAEKALALAQSQARDRLEGRITHGPFGDLMAALEQETAAIEAQSKVYGNEFDKWGAMARAYQSTLDDMIRLSAELTKRGYQEPTEYIKQLTAGLKEAKAKSEAWQKAQQKSAETGDDFAKVIADLNTKSRLLGESFDLNSALANAYQSEIERLVEVGLAETAQCKQLVEIYKKLTATKEEVKATTMELTGAQQAAVSFYKELIDIEMKARLLGDDYDKNAALASAYHSEINRLIESGQGETEQCQFLIAEYKRLTAVVEEAKEKTVYFTEAQKAAEEQLEATIKAIHDTADAERQAIIDGIQAELDKIDFEEQWTSKLRGETATRAELLEDEKNAALVAAERLGIGREQILAYFAIKEKDLIKDMTREWINTATDLVSRITNIVNQVYTNQEKEIDNWYRDQKQAIEKNIKDEEERAKKLKALDEEADKRRREMVRKQAIADKAASIVTATINTAMAVTQALASLPPPASFIMAGIVGGLGAAQIALIAAQPLPELAEGGLVTRATQAIIGEGDDDEAVLPLNRNVFNSIAEGIVSQMAQMFGATSLQPATAGGGAMSLMPETTSAKSREVHIHFHKDVIADNIGVKGLARRINKALKEEEAREGR